MDHNLKTIIVTGANRGIGYGLVEKLLDSQTEYFIILTARDSKKGEEAVSNLTKDHPNSKSKLISLELDVSSRESILNFTRAFLKLNQKIDILVNNAGVGFECDLFDPNGVPTSEEIVQTLAINFTGLVDLTQTLLPFLTSEGKIIHMSSYFGELFHHQENVQKELVETKWDINKLINYKNQYLTLALQYKHQEKGFNKRVYALSKALVNIYNKFVLKPQLVQNQVTIAVHPGWVKTDLGTENAFLSVEEGTLSAMTAINFDLKESLQHNGSYLWNNGKVKEFY